MNQKVFESWRQSGHGYSILFGFGLLIGLIFPWNMKITSSLEGHSIVIVPSADLCARFMMRFGRSGAYSKNSVVTESH